VRGTAGGLIGALTAAGVSKEDAHVYAEGIRRGGTLVTARVPDGDRAKCEAILSRASATPLSTIKDTGANPFTLSACAAAGLRSITRPCTKGPRSLIRTTAERPLLRLTTVTFVPNGSMRCAAVMAPEFICSPLAV
jgi:hypothetical protein